MIQPRQIRAARALLNWSQQDLAKASGIAISSIKNIENDLTVARRDTLAAIQEAFEKSGVEFLPNSGVRFKTTNIEVFEGPLRFSDFYELIYTHLKKHGGDVCIGGSDLSLYSKYRSDPGVHRQRMMELLKERNDVSVRILCKEGNSDFDILGYAKYRWLPEEQFSPTSFYTFGDYLALISFFHEHPPQVILLHSAPYADAYRRTFELAWKNAKQPEPPQ
jgi:transcriptional regulator with XRE-family HTH domain